MPKRFSLSLIAVVWTLVAPASAQEPGWASEVVVPTSTQRQINAVPIVERPYRPLHIYGNTVRRLHYRGRVIPTISDIRNAQRYLTRRPYVPVQRYLKR